MRGEKREIRHASLYLIHKNQQCLESSSKVCCKEFREGASTGMGSSCVRRMTDCDGGAPYLANGFLCGPSRFMLSNRPTVLK
jgi:hypothetical protein